MKKIGHTNPSSLKKLYSIPFSHNEAFQSVSKDIRYVACGGWDRRVKIKDHKQKKLVCFYKHEKPVMCIRFSKNGRFVASGGQDNQVIVCNIDKKDLFYYYHKMTITKVFLSYNGDFVLSGDHLGTVVLGNIKKKNAHFFYCHKRGKSIWALTFSSDFSMFASGGRDKQVVICDTIRKSKICSYTHDDYVKTVAFSKDCNFVVSGGFDKKVIVWDIKKETKVCSYSHSNYVTCAKFIDDTDIVISCSKNGEFILYRIPEKAKIAIYKTSSRFDKFDRFFFSKDGEKIISEADDKKVNIYKMPMKIHVLKKFFYSEKSMKAKLKKIRRENKLTNIVIKTVT
ncbi:hypothetical protein ACFLYU_05630 [Candidatus Dependentiae bacterium]